MKVLTFPLRYDGATHIGEPGAIGVAPAPANHVRSVIDMAQHTPFPLPAKYARRLPLDLEQPCWAPFGAVAIDHGYLRFMLDGDLKYAHRVAYQLHVGAIPKHWEIDHVCHTIAVDICPGGACAHRGCWNPAHLEAVTTAENMRRGNLPMFAAIRQQTCQRGHDLTDPKNLTIKANGRRQCRVCLNLMARARRTK